MYLTVRKPQNRMGLFDGAFDRMLDGFLSYSPWTDTNADWAPRADIHETADSYLVQLDLPGLEKKDVKVTLKDNVLTISGERSSEQKTDDDNYHRVERYHGSFCRSFRLDTRVQSNKISANFKNGVLEVTVPKAEEVKPKEIEVKVE